MPINLHRHRPINQSIKAVADPVWVFIGYGNGSWMYVSLYKTGYSRRASERIHHSVQLQVFHGYLPWLLHTAQSFMMKVKKETTANGTIVALLPHIRPHCYWDPCMLQTARYTKEETYPWDYIWTHEDVFLPTRFPWESMIRHCPQASRCWGDKMKISLVHLDRRDRDSLHRVWPRESENKSLLVHSLHWPLLPPPGPRNRWIFQVWRKPRYVDEVVTLCWFLFKARVSVLGPGYKDSLWAPHECSSYGDLKNSRSTSLQRVTRCRAVSL